MLMNAEVYDAFRDAGASEEKARAAAQSIAQYDDRLARLERRVEVLTWIGGTNLVLSLAILGRLLVVP
jgi:hypothetical protein